MAVDPIAADGVVVASAWSADLQAPGIFAFAQQRRPITPLVYVGADHTDAELDALVTLVTDAVASAKRLRRRGGQPEPPKNCPGCGIRIFGDVARRGGCRSCYPDLPPTRHTPVDLADGTDG